MMHNKGIRYKHRLDDIRNRGFNASGDAPTCFWWKAQLERYPDAKVILNVRGDGSGEAWQRSFAGSILQTIPIVRRAPFRWISGFQKFEAFHENMMAALDLDNDPETDLPYVDQLPRAYDEWVKNVKRTVPEEKLLIHAAQDGWEPLCGFLSTLSPEIEAKCSVILASDEPYPNVNEKAEMLRVMGIFRCITLVFETYLLI